MTPLPIQTALTSAAVNHITFPCSPQRHFQRKNRGFPAFSCADCTEPDAVFQSLSMPLRVIYFMFLPRWPFLPEACTAKHSGSCSEVFRNFTGSAGLSHSSTFSLPCHRLSFFFKKDKKNFFFRHKRSDDTFIWSEDASREADSWNFRNCFTAVSRSSSNILRIRLQSTWFQL